MKTKHHGQMSESFLTAVFLSLSGGLQDAYTYLFRGKVFANAQTGNIVLLSTNIMDGRWDKVLHYLVPLCAFALGVLAAEKMREHFQAMQRLHWRQLVVLGEVLLLFAVGFLPQSQNLLANAIVSFSCAMQVQAFRKVNGYAFASTMCIGDLRSGVEAFCIWRKSHEPHAKDRWCATSASYSCSRWGQAGQARARRSWAAEHLALLLLFAGQLYADVHTGRAGGEPGHRKRPDRHPAGDPGDRPHPEAGAAGGAAGADAERPEITKKGLLHIIGAAALFG